MNLKEKLEIIIRYAFEKRDSFVFNSKKHDYFYHLYNATVNNERFIEVPIVKEYLNDYLGKNILEIGNVLSHYFDVKKEFSPHYTIVDKYEKAPDVINEDIADVELLQKYNLIISISTLEHTNEPNPKDNCKKEIEIIKKIKGMLAPSGTFVCTLPIGYHPPLQKKIDKLFDEVYYLRRISENNKWEQCEEKDAVCIEYGTNSANAIIIGVVHKAF